MGDGMVILAQQTAPMVPRNSSVETLSTYTRINTQKSLATTMPTDRQTSLGLVHPEQVNYSSGHYERWKKSKIYNPKQASSAITSENFLKSKIGMEPLFMHNIGATKRALISMIEPDKPRHSDQVNFLA